MSDEPDTVPSFPAHSANLGGLFEPMRGHCQLVSQLACEFAAIFGAGEQAAAMGLIHDVAKYSDRFRRHITLRPAPPAGNHTKAGAYLSLDCYKERGLIPAAAILGHHGGLQTLDANWDDWKRALEQQIKDHPQEVTEANVPLLVERFRSDGLSFAPVSTGLLPHKNSDSDNMLDTRMLFSALVDADFLATEAHFDGDAVNPYKHRPRGPELDPARALAIVQQYVNKLQTSGSAADNDMQAIRRVLYESCLSAGELPPGLFTLAAPTGSGKTLSMLAFALRHAMCHKRRRVVLVMPFLNIIDQTASLYRKLFNRTGGFPEGYVLEDHSLSDRTANQEPDDDSRSFRRLLAENWDAPIVLTTSVRCLESLMSHRTSDCRKLHRLADSVIMFDEVQTLPKELAVATLSALSRLQGRFGATVVLATATQPAFEHLNEPVRKLSPQGWSARNLVQPEKQESMFSAAATRTQVHWEHKTAITLDDLSRRLGDDPSNQWMCIVNLKRHAQQLIHLLAERKVDGLFHLSTSMCVLHRQKVLAEIDERLSSPQPLPVRLISTQCVEAGVDIDFPVVYRALAPLDSIAQAAGRCNRHGRRSGPGRVHVFKPADEGRSIYPPGYAQASEVTETFVNEALKRGVANEALIHDPEQLRRYFRNLYDLSGTGKNCGQVEKNLTAAIAQANFPEVAKLYRLISGDMINILVRHDSAEFARLLDMIRSDATRGPGFIRQWISAARPLSVSICKPKPDATIMTYLESIRFSTRPDSRDEPDWYAATPGLKYDERMGLEEDIQWSSFA